MRLKSLTRLMIAALGAVALTAIAGGDKGTELTQEQQNLMSKLDTNGDGKVSQMEAQTHPTLAQRFREIDENGDKQLEKAEFARFEIPQEDVESEY